MSDRLRGKKLWLKRSILAAPDRRNHLSRMAILEHVASEDVLAWPAAARRRRSECLLALTDRRGGDFRPREAGRTEVGLRRSGSNGESKWNEGGGSWQCRP